MFTSLFDPLSVRPADEVAGWRVLHPWRQDAFSVTWVVERAGEHRLLRMALGPPGSPAGTEMEKYLEREVGALRRVRHPCIIRLHDEGRWPDRVHGYRYLLLEYVEDANLLAARKRGMTAADVVSVMGQLALAIEAMRQTGVSHGAIGPKNIVLRENGEPLLVDFSLADWPGNPFPPEHESLAGPGKLEEFFRESGADPRFQTPILRSKRFLS